MAPAVSILCAATSVTCFALLLRSYRASRGRLVLWSAVCFAGLALNNIVLAVNEVVDTSKDIAWRGIPAAVGLLAFLYGLATEEGRYRRRLREVRAGRERRRAAA